MALFNVTTAAQLLTSASTAVGGDTVSIDNDISFPGSNVSFNGSAGNPIIVEGNGNKITGQGTLRPCSYVDFQNIEWDAGSDSGNSIIIGFDMGFGVRFLDSSFHGVYKDPAANYSAGYTQVNRAYWQTDSSTAPHFIRCHFYDLFEGTVITCNSPQPTLMQDLHMQRIYSDPIKFVTVGDSLTAGMTFERIVQDTYIGDPANAGNPHIDGVQWTSFAGNDGQELENVVFRDVYMLVNHSVSSGRGIQGIAAFTDGGSNMILKQPLLEHCALHVDSAHGNTFAAINGATIRNCQIIRPAQGYAGNIPALNWGAVSAGSEPIIVEDCILRNLNLNGNTATLTNNLIIDDTDDYSVLFQGTSFPPADFNAFRTDFQPTVGGAADDKGVFADGWQIGSPLDPAGWTSSGVTGSGNTAPTASAGADRAVQSGTLVTLAGAVGDADAGDTLTQTWRLVSGPAVTLSSYSALNPTFTPTDGVYVFGLTANDGTDDSSEDFVTITASSSPASLTGSTVTLTLQVS